MGFLDAKVDIKGIENLPKDGLYTFVSNHPLGGQDGVALGYVLGKHYEGKVKYLVNDLLMNLRGLAPLQVANHSILTARAQSGRKHNQLIVGLKSGFHHLSVTFGKPIPWQTFDKSKTPAQWAEYVKDIVYKL